MQKPPKQLNEVAIDMPALEKTLSKVAAFRFARDRETEVSECYATTVMQQANPHFAQVVQGMGANQAMQHYGQLIAVARNYPA